MIPARTALVRIAQRGLAGVFLAQLYRIPGIKRYFDGVALHPYVADADAMRGEIENLRRVMRLDAAKGTVGP